MTITPFGKYMLLEHINAGGMAEVFRAKAFGAKNFSRIVAIKRILPNYSKDKDFITMFIDEAQISVKLSHANIVQVYELGESDELYYIAMEYIQGRDLRQILDRFRKQKRVLPVTLAAYIAAKICEGLDYAHRKLDVNGQPLNLVHRDVSPQNILLSYEGDVKLTDFGIAKAENRATETQHGIVKGKFAYMSPEQIRGLAIDHRSDIFAMGAILYEMVTNKKLFEGDNEFSTMEKVRNVEMVPPTQVNPTLSPEVERIILKALTKDVVSRYQWASEMAEDLQKLQITEGVLYSQGKLAGFLQEIYGPEIEAERAKAKEFDRVGPPEQAAEQASDKTTVIAAMPEDLLGTGSFNTLPAAVKPNTDPDTSTSHKIISETVATPPLPPPRPVFTIAAITAVAVVVLTVLVLLGSTKGWFTPTSTPPPPPSGDADKSPPPPVRTVLRIQTTPSEAKVYIDDAYYGDTPRDVPNLDPSKLYRLKIIKRDFEDIIEEKISIPAGEVVHLLAFTLEPKKPGGTHDHPPPPPPPPPPAVCNGFLSVSVRGKPGVKIYINGQDHNLMTPLFKHPVTACNLSIRLVDPHSGASKTINRTLANNETVSVIENM